MGNPDIWAIIAIFFLFVLFAGEPDIQDAIVHSLGYVECAEHPELMEDGQ